MDIKDLKKTLKQDKGLKLSNEVMSKFFDLSLVSFANSSAKKRYETALCRFYEFLNNKK